MESLLVLTLVQPSLRQYLWQLCGYLRAGSVATRACTGILEVSWVVRQGGDTCEVVLDSTGVGGHSGGR